MATRTQRFVRTCLRITVTNLAGAAVVALILIFAGGRQPLRDFSIALAYAVVIGTPAALLLPWLERRLGGQGQPVPRLLIVGVLIGLAGLGSAVVSLVLIVTGARALPAHRALTAGFGIALLLALPVYFYEVGRQRRLVAERRREQAEHLSLRARLASLESRLEPHYLFNSLEAITGIVIDDPVRAERLLEQFADLLEASLAQTDRHTVPLRAELAIARAYLDIEQARLGHRVRYSVDVPPALEDRRVPPFSLQGLAQNSVKHVASKRAMGGTLHVEGRLDGERLVLAVTDDGPGFVLAEAPPGRGLATLQAQLATLFGDAAGLEVRRKDGHTRVVMWLPATLPEGLGA